MMSICNKKVAQLLSVGGIEGPNAQNQNNDKDMQYARFLMEPSVESILYM